MNYTLRMLRSGTVEVPYPEVYWMERFQDWTRLEFQFGRLQGGGKSIVVNTGFPEDISALAQGWREYLGDRAVLELGLMPGKQPRRLKRSVWIQRK